jgi:hypothetical protein
LGKPEIMPILPTIAAKSFKTAGNQSMCRIGDLSHHPVLLFERPRSQFIYDLDPLQGPETRVKVLGMLSKDEEDCFTAVTFPGPEVGHVAEEKAGVRSFPKATQYVSK